MSISSVGEASSPAFFDDLSEEPKGILGGRAFSLPSWRRVKDETCDFALWVLDQAGRFGEVETEYSIEGQTDVSDEIFTGLVGEREIASNIRITAINGIQHTKEDAIALWEDVSRLFATRVHFVYNETKGSRAVDGTHAFWDKYVRSSPQTVSALAEHWERLSNEVGSDGYIYHIAHSHGALLTAQAADIVSAQVRSRLIIRTYGAFQNPHHKDFADIKNVVCPDDPVVRWLNWYEDSGDVVRVRGVPNPQGINDNHAMRGVPYWSYLEQESYDFREKYESTYSKFKGWFKSIFNSTEPPSAQDA